MLISFVRYRICAAALSIFFSILAFSEAHSEAVFKYPRVDGFPMDDCLEFAADCEQTAADYFCGLKGYTHSRDWATEDSSSSTKTMRTRQICDSSQWICGTFTFIDCATPRSQATPTNPISLGTFSGNKQYTTGPEAGITYDIKLGELSEHNGQLTGRYSLTAPEGSTKIFDGTKWDTEVQFKANPTGNPSCTHVFRGVLSGDKISGEFTTDNDCHGNGTWTVSWDLALQTPSIREGQIEVGVIAGGLGIGNIVSEPAGIDCPSNASSLKCRYNFPGTVTLTAIPHNGSTFTGWSGACHGVSDKCTISGDNQSLSVAAGFDVDAFTPPEELTVEDVIGDVVAVLEFTGQAAEVVHRISGKDALRKYSAIFDLVRKNGSKNLRGMVVNAMARKIFIFTGKTAGRLAALDIARSAKNNLCDDTLVEITKILDDDAVKDKGLAIELAIGKWGLETVADFLVLGTPEALHAVLYHTRYINAAYWLNPRDGEIAFDTAEGWIKELDVRISKGLDSVSGFSYDLLDVSSNRLPEAMYIKDVLSVPCR